MPYVSAMDCKRGFGMDWFNMNQLVLKNGYIDNGYWIRVYAINGYSMKVYWTKWDLLEYYALCLAIMDQFLKTKKAE